MTAPTTQREADERAAFEAYMREQGATDDDLKMPYGGYFWEKTADAWSIWQARAATDQSEAPALLDLSGLPLYFKEGVENGGYYLATDVIRLVTLARQAAPEAPAAATDQPSAGHVDELVAAADAVVERWHSRDWKQPHTAEFIARLAAAVGEAKRASLTPTAPQAASQQAGATDEAARKFVLGEAVRNVVDVRTETDGEQAVLDEVITRLHMLKGAPQAATTASTSTVNGMKCDESGSLCGATNCCPKATTASAATSDGEIAAWEGLTDLFGLVAEKHGINDIQVNGGSADELFPRVLAEFIVAASRRAPVQAAQPALPAEDPRITALYKLRDIAERDEDIESANIIQAAISDLHWSKVDAAHGAAQTADKGQTNE